MDRLARDFASRSCAARSTLPAHDVPVVPPGGVPTCPVAKRAADTLVHMTENDRLIEIAAGVLNPHSVGGHLFGDVGCSLVTDSGNHHVGVCIDTGSGIGFCAEHAASAAMVTAGEYRIAKIVAVWRDDGGRLHVLPPCGRCREFMRQVDPGNLGSEVVLGRADTAVLAELLPHHRWPEPLT